MAPCNMNQQKIQDVLQRCGGNLESIVKTELEKWGKDFMTEAVSFVDAKVRYQQQEKGENISLWEEGINISEDDKKKAYRTYMAENFLNINGAGCSYKILSLTNRICQSSDHCSLSDDFPNNAAGEMKKQECLIKLLKELSKETYKNDLRSIIAKIKNKNEATGELAIDHFTAIIRHNRGFGKGDTQAFKDLLFIFEKCGLDGENMKKVADEMERRARDSGKRVKIDNSLLEVAQVNSESVLK
jgi:hypothetical protein